MKNPNSKKNNAPAVIPFNALEKDPRFIKLSGKNKKLVPDKYNKFLIWNIPAVETCPNATPHCIHACYARKAERMFPGALPSRRRNFKLSTDPDFVDRMLFTIAAYMSKPAYKNAKNVIFRIHESGDFYSPEYVNAWLAIIAECEKLYKNLHFMAYTKSTNFFRAAGYMHGMFSNFNLLGSVWDDTPKTVREDIAVMNLPIYTADTAEKVAAAVASGTASRCRCDDCAHCGKCIYGRCMLIYCVIH